MAFTLHSSLPPEDNICDSFKKKFPGTDIKYITRYDNFSSPIRDNNKEIEKPTDLSIGYVFKIGDKYYSVNPEDPNHSLSNDNHRKELINNFCNDLIKESRQDILPNLLKDCKTINDIKQKLPNVGYEYDQTRRKQFTLKLGDVEFSVPFKKSLSDEDKKAIDSINFSNTNQSVEEGIPPVSKTTTDSVAPIDVNDVTINISENRDTLKNIAFESIELFDPKSFVGIKIVDKSSGMCY